MELLPRRMNDSEPRTDLDQPVEGLPAATAN